MCERENRQTVKGVELENDSNPALFSFSFSLFFFCDVVVAAVVQMKDSRQGKQGSAVHAGRRRRLARHRPRPDETGTGVPCPHDPPPREMHHAWLGYVAHT